MRWNQLFFIFFCLLTAMGCHYSDDDDLRTVPVTNNPLIIPEQGGGIPGMPDISPRR